MFLTIRLPLAINLSNNRQNARLWVNYQLAEWEERIYVELQSPCPSNSYSYKRPATINVNDIIIEVVSRYLSANPHSRELLLFLSDDWHTFRVQTQNTYEHVNKWLYLWLSGCPLLMWQFQATRCIDIKNTRVDQSGSKSLSQVSRLGCCCGTWYSASRYIQCVEKELANRLSINVSKQIKLA